MIFFILIACWSAQYYLTDLCRRKDLCRHFAFESDVTCCVDVLVHRLGVVGVSPPWILAGSAAQRTMPFPPKTQRTCQPSNCKGNMGKKCPGTQECSGLQRALGSPSLTGSLEMRLANRIRTQTVLELMNYESDVSCNFPAGRSACGKHRLVST